MVWEGTKTCLSTFWTVLWFMLGLLTISNIRQGISTVRSMTFPQIMMAVGRLFMRSIIFIAKAVFSFIWLVWFVTSYIPLVDSFAISDKSNSSKLVMWRPIAQMLALWSIFDVGNLFQFLDISGT